MARTSNDENPRNRRGGLSPREAANELGVCVATVYVLLGNGQLPSYKIGRARRITREAIDAIMHPVED